MEIDQVSFSVLGVRGCGDMCLNGNQNHRNFHRLLTAMFQFFYAF